MSGTSSIPPENGKTSSSPEPDSGEQIPFEFVCRDPENSALPCPICDGKGVFAFDVPLSDPRFGKFQRCPNHPVQNDRDMLERLRRYGNLQAYQDKTFDNFETESFGGSYTQNVIASLREAKQQSLAYAQEPRGWIVFEGTYGCGKTHLAVAIANARLEKFGHQVIFVTAPDLLDFLRMSFDPQGEGSYDEYFERIRNVSLLLLDDLGVENPSPWAKEKLFQLLNYRHVNKLPTIITTNNAMEDFDPWLSSRIMDNAIVTHIKINAPDYRRTKRSQALDSGSVNLQLYRHMRFETFDIDSAFREEAENLRRAIALAQDWARKPERWLCLMGDFGCGKTHLAASIANDLHGKQGKDIMFTTVSDLLDYLRLAFDPQSNSRFDKRFHEILNIPILILDDLRLASATPWAKEKLFQIIDYRYLAKMPTVITTSDTMAEMDARVATRLMDRRVCLPFALEVRSYVKRTAKRS